jgi:hypothetical protein
MKPVIITLLYLTFGGNIEQSSFEIVSGESCSSWFNTNVAVKENRKKKMFSNHVYHEYNGKKVIGYICADSPPQ